DVGPPCGEFTLAPEQTADRPIVLMSGGIGITPILSMFKALAHEQTDTPVHFLHAARDSRVHAMASEVREVAAALPNARTHFRYDAPHADDLHKRHCDSIGLVDADFIQDWLPDNEADFYFCGPKPFMTGVYRSLKERGVPEERIHFEFF